MRGSFKLQLFMYGAATFSCLITILIRYQIYKLKQMMNKKNDDEYYYHLMFTDLRAMNCREHMNTREVCSETCSYGYLQKIIKFLASANSTISMCMYTISVESIIEELTIAAESRGIKVRIITDWEMTRTKKNIYSQCKSKQIEIRTQGEKDLSMMHHKFCLVDKDDNTNAKLFFGSLNLTMQGICGNFEHVIFTNDKQIVDRFGEEFEYLWNVFDNK